MKNFSLVLLFTSAFISLAHADNYDDATCDNVCSQIVDTTNADELGITGADSWTSSDDAWCAANPYSSASPPTSATVATQMNRCQYHNTQVLTYCIAYEKTQAAKGMEMPLMILDVAGAAICGTVCLTPLVSAPMYMACRADSTAAAGMEIYDALALDSDPLSRSITGVMGAAGLATNYVEYKDVGNLKQFFAGNDGTDDTKAKNNACLTAAILAAGAGMRAWDITHQQMSKEAACTDVKNLLSNSPVIGAVTATTTPVASGGSSSGTSGGTSAAHTNNSITGSGTTGLAAQVACVAQNGATQCGFAGQGQSSAATDGGLLTSSGLDKSAAQQLANSNLSGVSQTAPNAASMISSAMGDAGGDVATKIAEVAKVAQDEGQKLTKSTASFAGGAKNAVASASAPGFGTFDFDSAADAKKAAEMKFDRAPASYQEGDIWHTGFKGSIFQIISSKIVETKPRVDTLDWTTPLNRALMGLPKIPAQKTSETSGGLK